jgi:hypothetical protein
MTLADILPSPLAPEVEARVRALIREALDHRDDEREGFLLGLEELIYWRALEFLKGMAVIREAVVRWGGARREDLDALEREAAACLAVEGELVDGLDARVERLRRFEAWLLTLREGEGP